MLIRSGLAIAAVLIASPALGETIEKEKRMRQMTEVMFKNYPPRALAAGEQGAVFFKVTIDRSGQPTSCDVTHSSGHPLLDEETCNLIVQHGTFKSVAGPDGGKLNKSTHEGVVNWTLPGRAPVALKAIPIAAGTGPEKKICKVSQKTGSLVSQNRQCLTQREWDRMTKEAQDFWIEMQGSRGSTRSN